MEYKIILSHQRSSTGFLPPWICSQTFCFPLINGHRCEVRTFLKNKMVYVCDYISQNNKLHTDSQQITHDQFFQKRVCIWGGQGWNTSSIICGGKFFDTEILGASSMRKEDESKKACQIVCHLNAISSFD